MVFQTAVSPLRPANSKIETSLDDLAPHFARLAANEVPSLIVAVRNTGEFLQFSGQSGQIQLDLPLITQEQQNLEPMLLAALISRGLEPYVTIGSDGARFLDADLNGTPDQIATLVSSVFQEVFRLQADEIVVLNF